MDIIRPLDVQRNSGLSHQPLRLQAVYLLGVASVALLSVARFARCQVVGSGTMRYQGDPEFRVNTHREDFREHPDVVALPDGFLITWTSSQDPDGSDGVYGQLFDQQGTPREEEFRVHSHIPTNQKETSALPLPSGFAVFWHSFHGGGPSNNAFGQRFTHNGTKIGGEFQVNTFTGGNQWRPQAAKLPGGFVVVWSGTGKSSDDSWGISGQLFDDKASKIGQEFAVNALTAHLQGGAKVASNVDGFLVVWRHRGSGTLSEQRAYARYFYHNATAATPDILLHAVTPLDEPAVAAYEHGFVAVWRGDDQGGSSNDIFARRIDASGNPIESVFKVNDRLMYSQARPWVSGLGDGFVVVWQSSRPTDDNYDVCARIFDAKHPAGRDVLVHENSTEQPRPRVASFGQNFVVTWSSANADPDGSSSIFARIFRPAPPMANLTTTTGATTTMAAAAATTGTLAISPSAVGGGDNTGLVVGLVCVIVVLLAGMVGGVGLFLRERRKRHTGNSEELNVRRRDEASRSQIYTSPPSAHTNEYGTLQLAPTDDGMDLDGEAVDDQTYSAPSLRPTYDAAPSSRVASQRAPGYDEPPRRVKA